jgi:hypothetical protein
MQNHIDRDSYVNIYWNNIQPSYKFAFNKVNSRATSNFNTNYDYDSVMHYAKGSIIQEFYRMNNQFLFLNPQTALNLKDAFALNYNYLTIAAKDSRYTNILGQRQGMSNGDAIRLNNMYKC